MAKKKRVPGTLRVRRRRRFRRRALSEADRAVIRAKTKGCCHICGGRLGERWVADHVVAHAGGGEPSLDNLLPACRVCNGLRWHWTATKIRKILQLGIYANREIRNLTPLGKELQALYRRRTAENQRRQGRRRL